MTHKQKVYGYMILAAVLLICAAAAVIPAAAETDAGIMQIEEPAELTDDLLSAVENAETLSPEISFITEEADDIILPATEASVGASSVVTRDVVLVLDISGSMSGTPLTQLKAAAKKYIAAISKESGNNRVAIVSYESSAALKNALTNNWAALNSTIDALSTTGGTNMYAALTAADSALSGSTAAYKEIYLFSDGLPQSGTSSSTGKYTSSDSSYYYSYGNSVYSLASTLKPKYTIYTVGFFSDLSGATQGGDLYFGRLLMKDIQNGGFSEGDIIFNLHPQLDARVQNEYNLWDSIIGKNVSVSTPIRFVMDVNDAAMVGKNAKLTFTAPGGSAGTTFGGVSYASIPVTATGELVLGTSTPSASETGAYSVLLQLYNTNGTAVGNSNTVTFTIKQISTAKVTYNANGAGSGSVPVDSTNYPVNSTVTVLGNPGSLALSGYDFAGWNIQADGYGKIPTYNAGDSFTITKDTTLYAQWVVRSVPVTSVVVNGVSSIAVDSVAQFTATVLPANADNKAVLWSSSNPSVASINATGWVSGIAPGSAVITAAATDGSGVKGTFTVTVTSSGGDIPTTAVPLKSGWNFVSVPKKLASTCDTAAELFSSINTGGKAILSYNSLTKQWAQVTSDTEITPLDAYWIFALGEQSFAVSFDTGTHAPSMKKIYEGWNAVGLSAEENLPASIVFNNVNWRTYLSWDAAVQMYDTPIVRGVSGTYGEENPVFLWEGGWVYMDEAATYIGYA